MRLRLIPLLATTLIASGLLFGGWFAFRSLAMESPLADIVSKIDGVEEANITFTKDTVEVRLELNGQASIRDIYQSVLRDGAPLAGSRKINITVNPEHSPQLDQWWANKLFDIAQAMETKRYGEIPALLHEDLIDGMRTDTQMDEHNVYVRLALGNEVKFIVLERAPAMLGVWTDE